MTCFCWFFPLFAKQTAQTHNITSYGDGMTRILRPKFRSHGTNLGSLGLISQKATGKTFSKYLCPIIWDLYECPISLESHGPLKKLGTFRSWCECKLQRHIINHFLFFYRHDTYLIPGDVEQWINAAKLKQSWRTQTKKSVPRLNCKSQKSIYAWNESRRRFDTCISGGGPAAYT